jgi:hypothetical protein
MGNMATPLTVTDFITTTSTRPRSALSTALRRRSKYTTTKVSLTTRPRRRGSIGSGSTLTAGENKSFTLDAKPKELSASNGNADRRAALEYPA